MHNTYECQPARGLTWVATYNIHPCGICKHQRLRPTRVYAQSGQSLCWSLEYSTNLRLLTEHHLEFLRLKGCTGSSDSTHVKMPHCWKSHVEALFLVWIFLYFLTVCVCKTESSETVHMCRFIGAFATHQCNK